VAWPTTIVRRAARVCSLAGAVCLATCAKAQQPLSHDGSYRATSPKVTFDVSAISLAGLSGAADGAVAVSYEFCIPAGPKAMIEVQRIDPSARCTIGARGRIGCTKGQALCIGNTHQEGWLAVLSAVAALPYVKRIDRCFAE
jgi:hypothetical protein